MIEINLKVEYPRKQWMEIEQKTELLIKLKFYNKFSGDIVGIEMVKPVTEEEIRVLRAHRKDKQYYLKNKKTIQAKKLKYYWRKRLYGATALNEPFKGCVGHHITRDFIVYIPKKLHESIKHSLKEESPYNMEKINKAVIRYLRSDNKSSIAALIEDHLAST
jgi:hypothetical protein